MAKASKARSIKRAGPEGGQLCKKAYAIPLRSSAARAYQWAIRGGLCDSSVVIRQRYQSYLLQTPFLTPLRPLQGYQEAAQSGGEV